MSGRSLGTLVLIVVGALAGGYALLRPSVFEPRSSKEVSRVKARTTSAPGTNTDAASSSQSVSEESGRAEDETGSAQHRERTAVSRGADKMASVSPALPTKDSGAPEPAPMASPAHFGAASTQALGQRYAGFFEAHQVSSEQQQRVIATMAADIDAVMDIADISREKGLSPQEQSKLRMQTMEDSSAKLIAILGEDEAKALREYGALLPFRPTAENFAQRCAATGDPISSNTIESVAKALSGSPVLSASNPDAVATQAKLNAAAVSRLSSSLTPAQLEIFKQILAERK